MSSNTSLIIFCNTEYFSFISFNCFNQKITGIICNLFFFNSEIKFFKLAEELATNPRPGRKGFYPLEKNLHRGRIGRKHRIHWMIDDDKRTVTIIRVGSREGM